MTTSSSSDNVGASTTQSPPTWRESPATAAAIMLPRMALKSTLGITVALYILNQSHLLPRPLAAIVSKVLFYPTLPITASKRIGNWITNIDDTLVLGGAPFGFLGYPKTLREVYGVEGVINMCREWRGPTKEYQRLGIEELYLPTTDHFEPSEEDLVTALSFLKRYQSQGKRVYVHCRAGHGRSGAVAYAWMLFKDFPADPQTTNQKLCQLRNVRKSLWKQPNLTSLKERLTKTKGKLVDLDDDFFKRGDDNDRDTKKEL